MEDAIVFVYVLLIFLLFHQLLFDRFTFLSFFSPYDYFYFIFIFMFVTAALIAEIEKSWKMPFEKKEAISRIERKHRVLVDQVHKYIRIASFFLSFLNKKYFYTLAELSFLL